MASKILRIYFVIVFLIFTKADALENKILFKINNEIVTSVDIFNEINYLKSINKSINGLEKDEIFNIAKNTIVRDKIKKIEIKKQFSDMELKEEYLDEYIEKTFIKLGFRDLEQFKSHLKNYNVEYGTIEEKITTEAIWNQIILFKYKDNIKIDEDKIRESISDRGQKYQEKYSLSEIVFNVKKEQKLENIYNKIIININNSGFENAALINSISDTSKEGGLLGWVNSSSLSTRIKNELIKMNIGEFTKPITIPGGFIILKINDYKKEKIEINIETEVKREINIQTREQLNRYSIIYLNKLNKDIEINEL